MREAITIPCSTKKPRFSLVYRHLSGFMQEESVREQEVKEPRKKEIETKARVKCKLEGTNRWSEDRNFKVQRC